MTDQFQIRAVAPGDAGVVAGHRAAMFSEMGVLPPDLVEPMVERTVAYLHHGIASGEYCGWVATLRSAPEPIVAGVGAQMRQVLPFPLKLADGRAEVAYGRQAVVINVYTEPAYRRRGLARALMHEVLAWARDTRLESLVLHAAPAGRALYEALGFASTTEMRFMGNLTAWRRPGDA